MIDQISPESLRNERIKRNVKVVDLASVSGVHETTIFRIESGKVDPRSGTLRSLFHALDIIAPPKRLRRGSTA